MPDFTIHVPAHLLAPLQAVVTRYNGNTGHALTVTEWLALHVAEIALAQALAAEQTRLQQQMQADLAVALAQIRHRMTATPDAAPKAGVN